MAVVQCNKKHFYDNSKYRECPHCTSAEQADMLFADDVLDSRRVIEYAAAYIRQNMGYDSEGPTEEDLDELGLPGITENLMDQRMEGSMDALYVVGWLVCTKGLDYGRHFPLYAGFNRIGRESKHDIILTDIQVTEEEHCSVVYEKKKNVFYLAPKKGRNVYLGEELAQRTQKIQNGQLITLGETRLELVVFCEGEKKWIEQPDMVGQDCSTCDRRK